MSSKKRGWNWLFGKGAYISFKDGAHNVSNNSNHNWREGCDCVSSPGTGELLFYTNGQTLYGPDYQVRHTYISGGNQFGGSLGSNLSMQAMTIVQDPADQDWFYLFMVGDWGISSSDVKPIRYRKYNPYSDTLGSLVTLANSSSSAKTGYAENLTAVLKENGTDYWIITVMKGTNKMRLWTLSASGVSGPITHTIGFSYIGGNRYGQIKASSDGKKLAIAMGEGSSLEAGQISGVPTLAMWDFNDSTGAISNETWLLEYDDSGYDRYPIGLDFSPNSQNLFVSAYSGGSLSRIWKFRLNAGNAKTFINLTDSGGGAVQRAPNDELYVATGEFGGATYIHKINDPDSTSGTFSVSNFNLGAGKESRHGLPVVPQVKIDLIKDYRVYYGGKWYSVCGGDDIRYYDAGTSSWKKLEPGDKYWNASLNIWEEIVCQLPDPPEPPPEPEYEYWDIYGFNDPEREGYSWSGLNFTLAKTHPNAPIFKDNTYDIVGSTKYSSAPVVEAGQKGAYRDVIFQGSYRGDDNGQFRIQTN